VHYISISARFLARVSSIDDDFSSGLPGEGGKATSATGEAVRSAVTALPLEGTAATEDAVMIFLGIVTTSTVDQIPEIGKLEKWIRRAQLRMTLGGGALSRERMPEFRQQRNIVI
jgi:hypothetical protein